MKQGSIGLRDEPSQALVQGKLVPWWKMQTVWHFFLSADFPTVGEAGLT